MEVCSATPRRTYQEDLGAATTTVPSSPVAGPAEDPPRKSLRARVLPLLFLPFLPATERSEVRGRGQTRHGTQRRGGGRPQIRVKNGHTKWPFWTLSCLKRRQTLTKYDPGTVWIVLTLRVPSGWPWMGPTRRETRLWASLTLRGHRGSAVVNFLSFQGKQKSGQDHQVRERRAEPADRARWQKATKRDILLNVVK